MRKPQGYALWVGGDGPPIERDTFTCGHCCKIVVMPPMKHPDASCLMCMKFVCDKCDAIGTCTPFERKLEMLERRERLMEALRR